MFKGAQYVLKYSFGWEGSGETEGGENAPGSIVLQQLLPEGEEESA